jgi:Protein of unknown function (DUF2917)
MLETATSFVKPTLTERSAAMHTLVRDALMVLRPLQACQIRCCAGLLWVTLDGDARDFFLQPGESLICAAQTVAVVEARSAMARFTTT